MDTVLAIESHWISIAGSIVSGIAAIIIGFHASYALLEIARYYNPDCARLLLANGVLAALSFSMAGTLLKALALQSWSEISMFAFVLAFRTLLKQVFLHERGRAGSRAAN